MNISFIEKLEHIVNVNQSRLALSISPDIALIPQHILRYDEPFLPFGKAVIDATSEHVSCYIFDLPAYMALGAVGMIALERTIDYVGRQHITILDGAFSNNNFTIVMDENSFGVDAITLSVPFDNSFQIPQDRAVFLISDTPVISDTTPGNVGYWTNDSLYFQGITLQILTRNFVYEDRRDTFSDTLGERIERISAEHDAN